MALSAAPLASRSMDHILERLAVSGHAEAMADPPGINAWLCVAREHGVPAGRFGRQVPLEDMVSIPVVQLAEAVGWIHGHIRRHRILVHCNAGVGRSPSVIVAYLCSCGMGFGEAVEHVARRHPRMSVLPCLVTTIDELLKTDPP